MIQTSPVMQYILDFVKKLIRLFNLAKGPLWLFLVASCIFRSTSDTI